MQIVINGALPEPAIARELIKHLPQKAPALIQLLTQGTGTLSVRDPATDLCTPAQSWLLQAHGFTGDQAQHLSAGLAPLRLRQLKQIHSVAPDQPVWLAELVHIAPSREGAMLIPADQLALSESYSRALLQAIAPYLDDTGFQFEYLSPEWWRVTPPTDFTVQAASTELVSQSNLNNWWTQDVQTRPWRRLINEFQMLAFALPDNRQREQAGLPSVNSLWLFGGASCQQLGREPGDLHLVDDLHDSLIRQDWGLWLEQLAQLDRTLLAPLLTGPMPELVLTGLDRYAHVGPAARRIWPFSLFKQHSNWSQWWSPLS